MEKTSREAELKVVLLRHTPEPEKLVASAASLCYSKMRPEVIDERFEDWQVDTFLGKLSDVGHFSPYEHVYFTFGVSGIDRSLSHQEVRHRHQSISQKSQRYVDEAEFKYVIPHVLKEEGNEEALAIFLKAMNDITYAYSDISTALQDKGMKDKEAFEVARSVLPNATETMMIFTMNARELIHCFQIRGCNRAQQPIREMFEKVFELVYPICPTLFENAGPSCTSTGCKEGKMSCGKAHEVIIRWNGKKMELDQRYVTDSESEAAITLEKLLKEK